MSSSSSNFGDRECDACRGEISGIKNWKTIGFICMRVLLCINEPLLFKNCLLRIISMYIVVKYGARTVLMEVERRH
jgi:hypothetical protein